jgi:glycine cleavage system H lipoate-binding protein
MTVILIIATFALFIAIDYFRKGKPALRPVQAEAEPVRLPRMLPSYVSGFDVPENCRYHPGHAWAVQESPSLVRVGLDDFAARLTGKIDSIVLPKRGQWIRQGQIFATIFRDGNKTEMVSPIEGEVTNVNDALAGDSSLPCKDPYGKGWLMSVFSPDATTNFRNLLGGDVARRWMAEAASRLRARMPAMAGAVAQDGGLAVHDLTAELPGQKWSEITREFFLT